MSSLLTCLYDRFESRVLYDLEIGSVYLTRIVHDHWSGGPRRMEIVTSARVGIREVDMEMKPE